MALLAYQKPFGIGEMFRDYKSGGYNLELTRVNGKRFNCLLELVEFIELNFGFNGLS